MRERKADFPPDAVLILLLDPDVIFDQHRDLVVVLYCSQRQPGRGRLLGLGTVVTVVDVIVERLLPKAEELVGQVKDDQARTAKLRTAK